MFPLPTGKASCHIEAGLLYHNLKLEEKNDTSPFTNKIEELTQELEEHFRNE
jgi:hypothetical protein